MIEKNEFITISIPSTLYKRLEEMIEEGSFDSVSAYATHLLREALARLEAESKKVLSEEEEEKVKERLRALGYLD